MPDGSVVSLPVKFDPEATDVARGFQYDFTDALEDVSKLVSILRDRVRDLRPESTEITIGVGFEIKSGKLTALLAETAAHGTLEIALKWSHDA